MDHVFFIRSRQWYKLGWDCTSREFRVRDCPQLRLDIDGYRAIEAEFGLGPINPHEDFCIHISYYQTLLIVQGVQGNTNIDIKIV